MVSYVKEYKKNAYETMIVPYLDRYLWSSGGRPLASSERFLTIYHYKQKANNLYTLQGINTNKKRRGEQYKNENDKK